MKRSIAITLATLLACSAVPVNAGDKVTTTPVHFSRGSSSATLSGSFGGYDSVNYTLSARAGQTMRVSISGSSNANFNVFAPGGVPGSATALGSGTVGQDWNGPLPANGTYTVQVYQMRASARRGGKVPYHITFSIR
ncbi:g-type lysozyme inhibitor [Stenotrophomonas humi]|uniref:G-type lysozyme inhibitor n=1 Tax=Stenotrophomonas humi TaxID=405444 RepID=A0A0R0C8K4_9GAMM|nr:hypothetical protein [Stenotrophomonas humi]KRG65964.1 g-type lysozyme inhibitor [Stenotrophomonas humi]